MNSAPFLILETGQPVASLRRYGRFPHWIRVAAGLDADETVVVDVEHGGALPDHRDFAGVIVTGSAAYVTDRADWSERSAQWLRGAVHDDRPEYRRGFLTALSDRVRNEARVPTLVGGHLTTVDDANTAVAAGRADLVLLDLPEGDIERPLEASNKLLQAEVSG